MDDGRVSNTIRMEILTKLSHRSLRLGGLYRFALAESPSLNDRISMVVLMGLRCMICARTTPRRPFAEVQHCSPGFLFLRTRWGWMTGHSYVYGSSSDTKTKEHR